MLILVTVLVFLSTLGLLLGVYALVRGHRTSIENRLRRMVIDPVRRAENVEIAFVSAADRKRRKKHQAKGLQRYTIRMEKKLIQAGLPLRAQEFALIVVGIAILLAAMMFLLTGKVGGVLMVLGAAAVLPFVFVNTRIAMRKRFLNAQVSDMILLMANGLKAGHSLVQVMENVSREVSPPLSGYLRTFLRDTIMGMPMEEALVKLEQRAGDEDLSLVITAILIQYQVGGNLAEILDNISFTIKERVRLKNEIRALTAQGRLSAIIISLLPVGLGAFLALVNPEFLMVLFQKPIGWMMVGAAVFFQLVGVMFIRRIVDIKV
jgi:tight adherence protein B